MFCTSNYWCICFGSLRKFHEFCKWIDRLEWEQKMGRMENREISNVNPDLRVRVQFVYHQLYACWISLSQRSMSHFKFSAITIYSRQMSRMTFATWHNFRLNLYKLSNSCNQYLFKNHVLSFLPLHVCFLFLILSYFQVSIFCIFQSTKYSKFWKWIQ